MKCQRVPEPGAIGVRRSAQLCSGHLALGVREQRPAERRIDVPGEIDRQTKISRCIESRASAVLAPFVLL